LLSLIERLNNIRKEIRQEALNITDASCTIKKFITKKQAANLMLSLEQEIMN